MPGRWSRRTEVSGADRSKRESEVGIGVEELDLLKRNAKLEHVARANAVGRVDDRDDVALAGAGMDQLFVAEVLDDFGLGVYDCRGAADWSENQVLGPVAGDKSAARGADRLAELRGHRDVDARGGQ